MIELSAIILSYNTREITDKCISLAAEAAKKIKTEIIVVDNGSTDGTVEMIKKNHPKVKFIDAKSNLGFAAGNNLALRQAQGKYLVLINSDAFVKDETFIKTVEYFEKHEKVDVLGCRLNFADGKRQSSAGYLPTAKNIWFWMSGLDKILGVDTVHPTRRGFFEKSKKVEWVMGAYIAMRRKVYEETEGMDEHFFMYMEEVEWCFRMKQKGFSVWYVSDFEITHLDKGSNNGNIRGPLIKEMVGLKFFIQRHLPNSWWWLRVVMQLGSLERMLGWSIRGNDTMVKTYKEILSKI